MNSELHTFELLSTNLYYLEAENLTCSVATESDGMITNNSLCIVPNLLHSIRIDNSRLNAGGRINGREFLEYKQLLTESDKNEFLSKFRGYIIGYPYNELSVLFQDKSKLLCDVIRVKGGYKNPFPYIGYNCFQIDFIKLQPNGSVKILKTFDSSLSSSFTISKIPKVGQIISAHGSLLNPSDLVDFINGVKTSYMGTPSCNWESVRGNIETDSIIKSLDLSINLNCNVARFSFSENLYHREYEIISHSSMDPGNDTGIDSTDRYIWANLSFNAKSLVEIISTLSKISEIKCLDNICIIKFNSPILKSVFENITNVHLFESIASNSVRF